MKRFFAALLAALLLPTLTLAADAFEEGTHYQAVSPAVPVAEPGKIEVVELFWYGCPHCFHMEPLVAEWLKAKHEGMVFRRIPAIFAQQWVPHARAFYAVEALDQMERFHRPLFDAMHQDKRMIMNQDSLTDFAREMGIDAGQFRQAYDGPSVDAKVKKAMLLTRDYGIDGVPSFIVNGKYRVTASMAGSQEGILKVVDFLIQKERAAP